MCLHGDVCVGVFQQQCHTVDHDDDDDDYVDDDDEHAHAGDMQTQQSPSTPLARSATRTRALPMLPQPSIEAMNCVAFASPKTPRTTDQPISILSSPQKNSEQRSRGGHGHLPKASFSSSGAPSHAIASTAHPRRQRCILPQSLPIASLALVGARDADGT